ncbi:MAG: tetratricopeptide repeat protein [Anaerolineae bacterium]|nr:tetratricopeptide repeat protein [Anaerolineae bacterium]
MPLQGPSIRTSNGQVLTLPERYLERALDHLVHKRYDEALLDMEAALRLEPRNGEFLATRGYILLQAERLLEAEAAFATALKTDPRQWVAHYGRALMAIQRQQWPEALGHLSVAQRLDPQRPEVLTLLAAVYYSQGNHEAAQAHVQRALEALPDDDKRRREIKRWERTIKRRE